MAFFTGLASNTTTAVARSAITQFGPLPLPLKPSVATFSSTA